MNYIVDLLYYLVSVILSCLIFCIILSALNIGKLKIFEPIQKFIKTSKKKQLLEGIIFIISIFLSVVILDFFNLNYIGLGIVVGLFSSLTDVVLGTGIAARKNQNS